MAAPKTSDFVLAIHGGAGVISETVKKYGEAAYLDTLRAALAAGREVLANNGAAIDAVQAAVEVMEDSPLFNAGRGSVFAANGQHETPDLRHDPSTPASHLGAS